MTTLDGVALIGCFGLLAAIAQAGAKITTWLFWWRLRKLAKQRLAHPEIDA